MAGAAIGFAANYGRKALMQGMEATVGDWDEILTAEHEMALAIFDKMLATDETPDLQAQDAADEADPRARQACAPGGNGRLSGASRGEQASDADHLEGEHGYIKTFIYELNKMGADASNWLEKVREFRDLVHEHAEMEEQQVFPRFKRDIRGAERAKSRAS